MSNISDEPVFDGVYRAFLSRLYFHRHTIYSAIGTLAITGITLYVEQIRNRGVISPDDKIWTIGLGLAGFIAVELAILLSLIGKLEWVVDDKATQIDGVIREGNGLRYLMGNLTRIFSSGNECAHTAVQHAVIQLLAGIKTEESNSITIKGEMLSRLVYEHFWRNLVAAQALHHAKRVKNISVYATHAASVGVWHSDEYSRLWDLQKEFHSLGGKIYRIFLRGYDNRDSPEEFAEIISYMRQSDVVNAFYLDVQNDKDESIARHSDDCLLVKFDGAIYAFVARVKWHKGKGVIVNSTIELGSNAFVFRRSRWLKLIERLDPDLVPPRAVKPGLEVLADLPKGSPLHKMKNLS